MKKFLLTTIVCFSIGSVVMAQQTEPAKKQAQKVQVEKQAAHDARIAAQKKAYKKRNEAGSAKPVYIINKDDSNDGSASAKKAN